MKSEELMKRTLVVAFTALLAACGGSSDNRSPGSIVVEVPVECDDCGGGGNPPPVDPNEPPDGGDTIASVIPADLEAAISASGESAPDGREIYNIDVSQLPDGRLDPAGLTLGNDFVFRITGGALRVGQN